MVRAVPLRSLRDFVCELPPDPAMRRNIRYRLHRRVIEVRDAQLVLRPYSSAAVAALVWFPIKGVFGG